MKLDGNAPSEWPYAEAGNCGEIGNGQVLSDCVCLIK
jgi:hypothetical protein